MALVIQARFAGTCKNCKQSIQVGDGITNVKGVWVHANCETANRAHLKPLAERASMGRYIPRTTRTTVHKAAVEFMGEERCMVGEYNDWSFLPLGRVTVEKYKINGKMIFINREGKPPKMYTDQICQEFGDGEFTILQEVSLNWSIIEEIEGVR